MRIPTSQAPILCGFFLLCCTGLAQDQGNNPTSATELHATASCSPNDQSSANNQAANNKASEPACHLGSVLTLRFDRTNNDITDENAQKLELMLNGQTMTGLKARRPLQTDSNGRGVLIFDLDVQSSDRSVWLALLAVGLNQNLSVELSKDGTAVKGVDTSVLFQALPGWWWAIFLMMAAIFVGFIALSVKTDILRDGPHLPNGTRLSFSLGRTQMAWWTFIIAGSFLYIWMITWDWSFLPTGVLVLMGISATTAMGAQLVDGNRNQRRQALLDQQRPLANRLDQINIALRAAPSNAVDLQTERTQVQAQLDQVNSGLASLPPDFGPSQNFFLDILQDDVGVSLHRFQLALWTLILGIVFIVQVLRSLSMPDFNDTLLALMGISAGTYVGFKIPDPPKQGN